MSRRSADQDFDLGVISRTEWRAGWRARAGNPILGPNVTGFPSVARAWGSSRDVRRGSTTPFAPSDFSLAGPRRVRTPVLSSGVYVKYGLSGASDGQAPGAL